MVDVSCSEWVSAVLICFFVLACFQTCITHLWFHQRQSAGHRSLLLIASPSATPIVVTQLFSLLLFASSYFNCCFLVSLLCFCCSRNNTQLPCSSLRWSSATTHLLRLHNLHWLSVTTHPFRLHASAAFTSPPCPSARRFSLDLWK